MSTIDYKAIAERLSRLADELAAFGHHTSEQRVDDLRTVVSLLEGMADKKPSAFAHRDAMGSPYVENWDDDIYALRGDINLYLHPAPQPQPERQPVSEPMDAEAWAELHRLRAEAKGPDGYATWKEAAASERICRVRAEKHLAERQPVSEPTRSERLREAGFTGRDDRIECDECGKKFTPQMLPIHKCEPIEAQIDYRALYHDLLFAVGNKHAGETRHETALRYIREAERSNGAALAAKDEK